MAILNPFNDVSRNDIQAPTTIAGQENLNQILSMKIGDGASAFKADASGIWLGANKFADAPFSVDINGNLVAYTGNITGVVRIGTGTGTAKIILDGPNKRIIINDGTDNRVLLGYQQNGF